MNGNDRVRLGIRAVAPAGAGIVGAALLFTQAAGADPTAGHGTRVRTQSPPMLCQIGSDDADPGVGPNVVCQGIFPQAPVEPCPTWPGENCPQVQHQDQAVVTAAGQFSYRDANIGVGDNPTLDTLVPGRTYQIQGWTIAATGAAITFTNDGTGRGMSIGSGGDVKPF